MTQHSDRTFAADFKRFFLRGLVVLLPSVLTLWIVVKAYQFVDTTIAEPINRSVRLAMGHGARFWEPLRNTFDPTDAQLDRAVAEHAIERGAVNRDAVRRELTSRLGQEPSEEQFFAAAAERVAASSPGTVQSLQAELRQHNIQVWWQSRWYMNLIGIVVAIVAVYTAGRLLGGFFGRRIYWKLEGLITTIPVFKQIYPYVKQIVDFLFSDEQPMKFNRVVAAEYPRRGIWSVGFLTGDPLSSVATRAGDCVTVFIPSSPTPFTGYTITVPKGDVMELPISVEEAIRFAVSGGVLIPDHQRPSAGMVPAPVPRAPDTVIDSPTVVPPAGTTPADRTSAQHSQRTRQPDPSS